MLVRLGTKSFRLGFNSTWTENFQMYMLGLEKEEELEIKLPTSIGSQRKQGDSRKKYLLLLYWLCESLWLCGAQRTRKFQEMGIPDNLTYLLRSLYVGQGATVRTRHGKTFWFQIGKGITRLYIVILLIQLICRVHPAKCWTGWITSWNEDCQKK